MEIRRDAKRQLLALNLLLQSTTTYGPAGKHSFYHQPVYYLVLSVAGPKRSAATSLRGWLS
jgi:hypothetical protein